MLTVVLIFILTVLSLSLRLGASGLKVSLKAYSKYSPKLAKKGKLYSVADGVVKFSLATLIRIMKLSAFIVARMRDLISIVGSIALLYALIILVVVSASVSGYYALFGDGSMSTTVIEEVIDK